MSSFMATKLNIANESDGGVKIRLFVDDSSRAIIKTCEKVTKHKLTKAQGWINNKSQLKAFSSDEKLFPPTTNSKLKHRES